MAAPEMLRQLGPPGLDATPLPHPLPRVPPSPRSTVHRDGGSPEGSPPSWPPIGVGTKVAGPATQLAPSGSSWVSGKGLAGLVVL